MWPDILISGARYIPVISGYGIWARSWWQIAASDFWSYPTSVSHTLAELRVLGISN